VKVPEHIQKEASDWARRGWKLIQYRPAGVCLEPRPFTMVDEAGETCLYRRMTLDERERHAHAERLALALAIVKAEGTE